MTRIEDDALVLDHRPFRDRDLLISVLTADTGLVRGVLRRARGGKRPQAAAAQILSLVRISGLTRRGAELATFSRIELKTSSFPLAGNLERAAAAAVVCELLLTFCPDGEPAPRRFRLGVSLLEGLLGGADPDGVVAYTQFWILQLAGVLPEIQETNLDPRGRRFLNDCRAQPISKLSSAPPGRTAQWLDRRSREEAERPLMALDFYRKAQGTDEWARSR
jgi:recombinational DNA repair protein (RecF pathway)